MNQDVKALPVVGWHAPLDQNLPFIPDEFKRNAPPEVFRRYANALVYQADAAAELRAEVERLRTALDHVRLQAGSWKGEAVAQRATVLGVGKELGGVPDYGPVVQGVADLRQRANTAEARLEEATALLKVMWEQGECYSSAVEWPRLFDAEGFYARVVAFLGEGNG